MFRTVLILVLLSLAAWKSSTAATEDPRKCMWAIEVAPGGNHLTDAQPGSGSFEEARTAFNLHADSPDVVFKVICWLPGKKPAFDIWSAFRPTPRS